MKQHTKQAAALLPCKVCDEPTNRYRGRWHRCPVKYRPAVAAALQQQYESGWNDGSKSALEARYPGMEAALAEKDLTHQALQSRAAKQILDLEIERDQLKQRVAELEAHVCFKIREQAEQAAACNQLDNENAHLRELHDNDMKRVADAEADTKRYQELSDKYCLEVGRRATAAKIEGIKLARDLLATTNFDAEWYEKIRAEIAALEKGTQ